jgi:hypothetical protein
MVLPHQTSHIRLRCRPLPIDAHKSADAIVHHFQRERDRDQRDRPNRDRQARLLRISGPRLARLEHPMSDAREVRQDLHLVSRSE